MSILFATLAIGWLMALDTIIRSKVDNYNSNDMVWRIHRGFYNGNFIHVHLRNPF